MLYCADGTIFGVSITCVILCIYGLCARMLRYIGNDVRCYNRACELSLKVNFNLLSRAPRRMVVYLNEEYRSTWLGNKAIYRTRVAIDDGGELVVIAPHVVAFGEDRQINIIIRRVGYIGTPTIMDIMNNEEDASDLRNNFWE